MKILILVLGVILGYFLPLLDHLVYVFFLAPQELTSQRVIYLIKNRNFIGAFRLLKETKSERKNLIFHTNLFLLVMIVLTFWLLTSSGTGLGTGLTLGMTAHLLLDRLVSRLYHGAYHDFRLRERSQTTVQN